MGGGKTCRESGPEENVENDETDDGMCDKCSDAGRGFMEFVGGSYGAAQGCTVSPNLITVCINNMIVAAEASKQGVTVG